MSNQLSFILLLPLILWSTFQGLLYIHSGQVTETVNLAAFEGQKEASLQGYYTDDIKAEIKDFLVDGYNMDPSQIEVVASEEQIKRGERMSVCVSVPSPIIHVMDIFNFTSDTDSSPSCSGKTDQLYHTVEREIMSEYVDEGSSI
ncbi:MULTISPECIES: hypothetical protein [Oceanobacillus]|uniref:Uncharacterized protein n=1 Tax=Oceanobacillus kimchii TaxID=746691 RepID=A0ABQ5TP31_9BACI|nr:hypothetical protein [Oceanobacillus kimchii]GLO68270.1 hypothetical protein MACH08_40540 [Oceanobacillus kimchii]